MNRLHLKAIVVGVLLLSGMESSLAADKPAGGVQALEAKHATKRAATASAAYQGFGTCNSSAYSGFGINRSGRTDGNGLPAGRTYYRGRYYGNYNNRFYGPQYGYF